jgi:hypothetical protein
MCELKRFLQTQSPWALGNRPNRSKYFMVWGPDKQYPYYGDPRIWGQSRQRIESRVQSQASQHYEDMWIVPHQQQIQAENRDISNLGQILPY